MKSCGKKFFTTNLLKCALAEMLGTFILVFLGCMGCVDGGDSVPSHLQKTLNFGIAVLIVIQCFGHISDAHVNPAMTVGSVVLGIKTISEGLIYFIAQAVGAILGYGLLKIIIPKTFIREKSDSPENLFCVTNLHQDIEPIQGLMIETFATATLMLIACGVWDFRNAHNTDSTSIKFGLSVTGLATALGPYTGCSMNPVRSLAPALWNGFWKNHWVYWFGPFGGALLASLAYKSIFFKTKKEDDNISENFVLSNLEFQKTESS